MFSGIEKTFIPSIWSHILPLLEKVLNRDPGRYTTESVLDDLLNERLQLWLGYEDFEDIKDLRIDIIAITKIGQFHAKKVLFIEMISGTKLYKWIENLDMIRKWGTDNGCTSLEFTARKGFRKYLRPLNFKEKLILYEAPL